MLGPVERSHLNSKLRGADKSRTLQKEHRPSSLRWRIAPREGEGGGGVGQCDESSSLQRRFRIRTQVVRTGESVSRVRESRDAFIAPYCEGRTRDSCDLFGAVEWAVSGPLRSQESGLIECTEQTLQIRLSQRTTSWGVVPEVASPRRCRV